MAKLAFIIPIEGAIYGLIWWLAQPAVSFNSLGFWAMIVLALAMIAIAALSVIEDCMGNAPSHIAAGAGIAALVAVVIVISVALFTSPMFMAKSYANLYDKDLISEGDMENYYATLENIPLTDKDTANKLIIRKMGSLKGDLVSQFNAGESYQITLRGESYRVAPLVYAGFFQWKNNKDDGIPAYIKINMETQETEIVYLEEGMKYSPSEMFGRDLKRYLRGNYPSAIFNNFVFELDENETPYWVVPVSEYEIGLFAGEDIKSVIVVNAVTGEHKIYDVDEVPEWVDNVYSTNILLSQYDAYGKYQNGFWNAMFAKKNATVTTDGYNYIPDENDVNIYTGVTSLVMDESNVGFVLINKRTKGAIYYEFAGAEEYSAMSSAEGLVQQFGYTATFPLLVKVEGVPTYYLALKDAGGLVKAYSLVNVQEYQKAVYGTSLKDAINEYLNLIGKGDLVTNDSNDEVTENVNKDYSVEVTGIITDIRSGEINGTTYFYVTLDNNIRYKVSLAESEFIIFANIGDEITFVADAEENQIISAKIK